MSFNINKSLVSDFTDNLRRTTSERLELNKTLYEIKNILKLCCDNDIKTITRYISCIEYYIEKENKLDLKDDIKNFLIFSGFEKQLIIRYFKENNNYTAKENTLNKFKEIYYNKE